MSSIFCCNNLQPYRPQRLAHEEKFRLFSDWVASPQSGSIQKAQASLTELAPEFVVQLVRQVNYGALEGKRYFARSGNGFVEITEQDIIQANFQKLNAYKNFKCNEHNKFFEVNVYQKDPSNAHHWRANVARPASEIDL